MSSQASQAAALRQMLEQRFPDAVPLTHRTAPQVATGVDALDAILPRRGLPRGRLTTWRAGGASTAVLSAACRAVAARGEGAVWIDAAGTVAGFQWRSGPLLVRPREARQAPACAEELLRSGGWGLIVLSGAGADAAAVVRLGRAAREGGGALVLLDRRQPGTADLRVESHIPPDGYRWRTNVFAEPAEVESVAVHVRATALGWSRETVLSLCVQPYELRLSLEPALADRAGR